MSTLNTTKSSSSQWSSIHFQSPWMICSEPEQHATSTCRGWKRSRAFSLIVIHKHFAVSLLGVSPTAIGFMSDLDASVVLFKATRFPPAKNLDMEGGALPPASKLTKHLKEVQIGV